MSSRRSTRRSGATGTGDDVVDLENSTPAPAVATAKPKTKVVDENENTASLFLECEEEPLSAAQKNFHREKLKDFNEQIKKLEELAKKGAQITNKGDGNVVFRTTSDSAPMPQGGHPNVPAAPLAVNKTGPNNCRLLMDPRTGRVLGTINGTGNIQTNISNTGNILQRGPAPASVNRMPYPGTPTSRIQASIPNRPSPPRGMSPSPVRAPAVRQQASVKPAQVVDLTRSGPSGAPGATPVNQAKSKYPALLVHPKPQDGQNNFRRSELDQKVKSLLVLTPAKLTEWLIKEGLVPQEQSEHGQKLKLGMYSDAKKFPNSGGYVWLSDDARNKYVSVFKSSIFETIIQPPSVILKLIYHYVCQTSLNNVLTWVKVDNATVDTFYRHLRCICIASVQEEIVNLGGENKAIELGVISLGTTTTDGNRREVKVEVLGVLERGTGRMRLRATEPVAGSNQAERFARIFKPLPTWVRRDSKIIADFSVDRERLLNMGYTNVFQCSAGASSKRGDNTNAYIMEYLKRVVPRMFQNSLSVLSTNVIQQFLDELTFREVMGKGPLQAFDGIISRIATQTSYVCKRNASMSTRIRTIGDNPFGDWRMTFSSTPNTSAASGTVASSPNLPPTPAMGIDALPPSLRDIGGPPSAGSKAGGVKRYASDFDQAAKRMKPIAPAPTGPPVDLESYYYGTIEGDIGVLMTEFKADMAFKCHLCKKVFMNNIEFMKHLSLHVENERQAAVDLADLCQCKYCLKDFDNEMILQKHLDDDHLKTGQSFICRICCITFPNPTELTQHMTRNHVRAEVPYGCQVCGFRTSSHREIVDHFTEAHDRTDKLMCPRCLKTYSLFSDKGYNSTMAAAFVAHMQTHQDNQRKKCGKCMLAFKGPLVDGKSFKAHLDQDHGSHKDAEGFEPYQYLANETPMKIPRPSEVGMKLAPKKSKPKLGTNVQTAFAAQNLEDLAMYDVDKEDACKECTKKMTAVGHFNAYLCCTKCRYSSCCAKALSIHTQIFHGPKKPFYNLGVPSLLKQNVYCVCGFNTNSGNKIAKHLALHGCRSAYSSQEEAQKAAIPVLQGPDEEDLESFDPNEVMAKAYMAKKQVDEEESPSQTPAQDGPLAFLGLQKKVGPKSKTMPKSPESEKKNKSPEAEKNSKAPTPDREKINKIEKISKLLTPSEPPKIEIEKVKEACRGWSMDTAPDKAIRGWSMDASPKEESPKDNTQGQLRISSFARDQKSESKSTDTPKETSEEASKDTSVADTPINAPEDTPEESSMDVPEDTPQDAPEDTPEDTPEDNPGDNPEDTTEDAPVDTIENATVENVQMDATEESSMDADLEGSIENLIQSLDDPKEVEESNETATLEGEVPEESSEPINTSENNDEIVEEMDES